MKESFKDKIGRFVTVYRIKSGSLRQHGAFLCAFSIAEFDFFVTDLGNHIAVAGKKQRTISARCKEPDKGDDDDDRNDPEKNFAVFDQHIVHALNHVFTFLVLSYILH